MQTSLDTKTRSGFSGVLRFRYIGPFEVDELAELWKPLHQQHTTIASHLEDLLGTVSAEESWRRRSRRYVEWLSEPETIAVIAESDGVDVGYAMVTIRDEHHGSWDRGDRVAVVQTLAVHPDYSLELVGSGLLDEVRRSSPRPVCGTWSCLPCPGTRRPSASTKAKLPPVCDHDGVAYRSGPPRLNSTQ